eukprot:TRINITY_DN12928_c0_g1_i4.p1 TRINITY_DN12928_c0_g1~~TRINITY_DN12928_c0_g1_i4.p1  ORF type:complete len:578 (-),score=139.92 TRINITY_DN12928_c0_g1_i4:135-1868(-)
MEIDKSKKIFGSKRSNSSPSRSRSRERERDAGYRPDPNRFGGGGGGSGDLSPDRRNRRPSKKKRYHVEMPGLDGPMLTLREFMERQKETLSFQKAEEIYNEYKNAWEQKQNDIFFGEHKSEEWFKEKYDPVLAAKLGGERKQQSRTLAQRFMNLLESGYYDKLSLDLDPSIIEKREDGVLSGEEEEGAARIKKNQPFVELYLKEGIDVTKAPYYGFDPNSMTLFIRTIPKNISRWDLEAALAKVPGFVSLSLSEPLKTQDYIRFGWILFDSEDKCAKAQAILVNFTIKDFLFTIVRSKSSRRPLKVVPNVSRERNETDLVLSRRLIEVLDREKGITGNPILAMSAGASGVNITKILDLQILYLRRVHSFCFYSGAEYHDERLLSAKCGPIILRLKAGAELENEPLPDIPDWHARVTELIRKRIEESAGPPRDEESEAQATISTAFDEYLRIKVLEEDQGKWPCPFCDKYFSGEAFLLKHIRNKHEVDPKVQEIRRKVHDKLMRRNYAADKNRITHTPSASSKGMLPPRRRNSRPPYQNSSNQGNRSMIQKEYRDLDDPRRNVGGAKGGQSMIDYNDL